MKKIQSTILFILLSLGVVAQDISPTITIDEVYTKIEEIINAANQALTKDCDPYGFQLSVKVSAKEGGVVSNVVNSGAILLKVEGMLADHNFERFNLDKPLTPYGKDGIMYFSAGLTPQNTTNEHLQCIHTLIPAKNRKTVNFARLPFRLELNLLSKPLKTAE